MVSPGVGGRNGFLAWCAETAILVLREPCRAGGSGCAGSDQGRPSRDPLLFGVLRYSPSGPCSPEFWVFIVNSDWFSATPTPYSLDIWPLLIKPLMVTRLEPELQFDTSAVGAYSQWTWEKGQESQAQRSKGTQLCEGLTCDWGSGWQWAGTAEEDSQWDETRLCPVSSSVGFCPGWERGSLSLKLGLWWYTDTRALGSVLFLQFPPLVSADTFA